MYCRHAGFPAVMNAHTQQDGRVGEVLFEKVVLQRVTGLIQDLRFGGNE